MKFFSLIKSVDIAFALTLIVTLVAISPSFAQAAGCTLKDLNGSYGYSEQGISISPTGSQTFISETGIITADGKGGLESTASAIWAPSPFPPQVQQPLTLVFSTTGPGEGYTVNSDCSGDAIFSVAVYDKNGPAGGNLPLITLSPRSIHFVNNTPNKGEFKFSSTSPGTVATGSAGIIKK